MSKGKIVLFATSFFLLCIGIGCNHFEKEDYNTSKKDKPPPSKKDVGVGETYSVRKDGEVIEVKNDLDYDSVEFCQIDNDVDIERKYTIKGLVTSPSVWRTQDYSYTPNEHIASYYDYIFLIGGHIEKIYGEDLRDFVDAGKVLYQGNIIAWKNSVTSKNKIDFNTDSTVNILNSEKIDLKIKSLSKYPKKETKLKLTLKFMFVKGGERCLNRE